MRKKKKKMGRLGIGKKKGGGIKVGKSGKGGGNLERVLTAHQRRGRVNKKKKGWTETTL